MLNSRLNLPDVWIIGDETGCIHLEFGDEPAARTLIPIGRSINAAVDLFERLERESGEAKPGCLHLCLLSDGQTHAAERKQVGQRAEVKIEVDASRHFGALCSIEPPMTSRINGEINLDCLDSDPARNLSR